MDNIYKYMEEKRYMTPAVLELDFYSDAVLCQSNRRNRWSECTRITVNHLPAHLSQASCLWTG